MKDTLQVLTLSALIILGLTQCRGPQKTQEKTTTSTPLIRYSYSQSMMGTRFSIILYHHSGEKGKAQSDLAAHEAFQLAQQINNACSDYDVTSELMRLNQAPPHQAITISPLLLDVLDSALNIAKQTHGAYDPTLGHHSYNWRMARKKGVLPSPESLAKAKRASGWKHLSLDATKRTVTKNTPHMRLDLGGIAKGYAAEKMLVLLQKHQIYRASVTAGGEVQLGDPPPNQAGWDITLKTLDTHHQLIPKTITLSNCAVSTSGDLHQSITISGQRYSHIVNPATGLGLITRISATIIADRATLTDALATAYCVHPHLVIPNVQSFVIRKNINGTLEQF